MNKLPPSTRKTLIIAAACILAIAFPLYYFFSWRPSDSDYAVSAQLIEAIDKTSKAFTVESSVAEYPGNVSIATPLKLSALANVLSESVDALDHSAPFSRDLTLKGTYDKHRPTLTQYKQSANQLTASIDKYASTVSSCGAFTESFSVATTTSYADLLTACKSAISEAEKSAYEPFNTQFLNKYLELTKSYINEIDKWATTSDTATHAAAKQKIDQLSVEIADLGVVELDFELPNITGPLKELSDTISRQSKAFLR